VTPIREADHRLAQPERLARDQEKALVVGRDRPRPGLEEPRGGAKEGRHRLGVEPGREVGRRRLARVGAHLGAHHGDDRVELRRRRADDGDRVAEPRAERASDLLRGDPDPRGDVRRPDHRPPRSLLEMRADVVNQLARTCGIHPDDQPVRCEPQEQLRSIRLAFPRDLARERDDPAHPVDSRPAHALLRRHTAALYNM